MHQAIAHGARRARYRGLAKTRLDHVYMACASKSRCATASDLAFS